MNTSDLRIVGYRPELAAAFAELNLQWIEALFEVEEADRKVLLDPQHHIIEAGGTILFAVAAEMALGCVALKPVRAGVLELTKMAVRVGERGQGIGALLMRAAIDDAQRLGAHELVLHTQSSLRNAIALYRRFGFEQVAVTDSPYRRADVSMRLGLSPAAAMTDIERAAPDAGADVDVQRFAAFCDGDQGGNPAGVVIAARLPAADAMQRIAAQVGFSETAFAAPHAGGWRVRYFSPETEVPFCGHATIALGAALALRQGDGVFALQLNQAQISVEGRRDRATIAAALQSPPTRSAPAADVLVAAALELFGYGEDDLDPRLPPARVHAGVDHLLLALRTRAALAAMHYSLEAGRALMHRHGLVTVVLAFAESAQRFHTRNPFASGGVYEDPATGAATAAMAGYLRDLGWPHGGHIEVVQGEDMGMRSRLRAEIGAVPGSSIRVSGAVRVLHD